jgi:site-specific DNA recombinase
MSAARKKGKWVGGTPVLGYDVAPGGGRLIVNEEEAEQVRAIFALFEENRSAMLTLTEIDRRGWHLKSWTRKTGEFRAGSPFDLSALRRLLMNILYTGTILHKGQPYPGEHPAILTPGTWERVQSLMTKRETVARGKERNKHMALLSGLLYCDRCKARMVYGYGGHGNRKYSYYRCLNPRRNGRPACPGKSLQAHSIEESVLARVRTAQQEFAAASEWDRMDRRDQLNALQAAVERIGYDGEAGQISIRFRADAPIISGQEVQA